MLSKTMQEALNAQVKHELYSAYLYLSMSAYCEGINLPGFANWMRVQYQEETGHALKFMGYIHDRGGRVSLQALEQPPGEFKSPQDVFQQTLDHERKVTGLIHSLCALSQKEGDYATQTILQWFVNEQIEEEKTASLILEQLKIVGDRGGGILFMDKKLGSRTEEE